MLQLLSLTEKRNALQFAAHWDFESIPGAKMLSAERWEGLEVEEGRGMTKTKREVLESELVMLNKKVYVTCSILRDQWGGCGLTSEHKDTSCLICKRKKHVVSPEEEHV